MTVGVVEGSAGWRAEEIHAVDRGAQQFVAVDPVGVHHGLRIGLPGRYNVANCLLAVALLDAVGVSPESAAPGLRTATVPGRLQPIDRGQGFLALVDYAHKPGALRAVLETLRAAGQERSDRVAAAPWSSGPAATATPGKREPMGLVAAELADLVVITDDNPRDEDPADIRATIMTGATAAAGASTVVEIGDRREAIDYAVGWARDGDVVLVAGKGHEAGQTSRGQTRPFDDRDELAGALEALWAPRVIDLTLAQIADIVGGELADVSREDAAAIRVTGTVEFDSRAVAPGGLFLALPGARSDGHDFAAAAVAAGAVAVLAARPVGVPAIVVAPASRGHRLGRRRPRARHRRVRRRGAGGAGPTGRGGGRRTGVRRPDDHRGDRLVGQDVHQGSARRRARPAGHGGRAAGLVQQRVGPSVDGAARDHRHRLPDPGDVGAASRQHRRAGPDRAAVDRGRAQRRHCPPR